MSSLQASDAPTGTTTTTTAAALDSLDWSTLSLSQFLHPSFPQPNSSPAAYAHFLLTHSNETLLNHGVADFPFLSDAGCALLSALTEGIIGGGGEGVGSMHNYGSDIHPRCPRLLSEIGTQLEPIFDLLFVSGTEAQTVPPADARPTHLALHSGHAIRYGKGGGMRETALKLHVDDSLVTATLCLRSLDLDGTDLVFHGAQRLEWPALAKMQAKFAATQAVHGVHVDRGEHQIKVKPTRGHALLHRGKHPHRTIPVVGGERISWVLWWHANDADAGATATAAATPGATTAAPATD
jgi:hypothetical protein